MWSPWGWWRYYCWRCEQWVEDEGPRCDLYRQQALTSECVFDERRAALEDFYRRAEIRALLRESQ